MIPLSLTTAAWLYGVLLGLTALGIFAITEFRAQRSRTKLATQNTRRCSYCAFLFLADASIPVVTCPRCGSLTGNDATTGAPAASVAWQALDAEEKPRRNPSKGKRPGAKRRGPRKRR